MAKAYDILYGDDGELLIKDGDFVTDVSNYQHIEDIMAAAPGHFRQYPVIGANILQQNNGIIDEAYKRLIRINLESDGFNVEKIDYTNGELTIEANRV